jgi:hypothetical protein
MWTVIKINKKKFNDLKNDFKKKLGSLPIFYSPKIKIQKFNKSKMKNYDFDLLGDYILCYHENISGYKSTNLFKHCIGLKYFLDGFVQSQKDLEYFVKKCKNHEDQSGYVKQSFFNFNKNNNFQFLSGPFSNFFFKILEERGKKYFITLDNFKMSISKNKTLFKPI